MRDAHRFSGDSLDLLIRDWAAWFQRNKRPLPPDFLERCRSEIDAGVAIPGGPDVMAEVRKMWPQLDDAVDGKIVEYGRLPSFKDNDDPAS